MAEPKIKVKAKWNKGFKCLITACFEITVPELPEVETIARTLAPSVVGRGLTGITILDPGTWQSKILPDQLCPTARPISATGRRGKLLLIYFAGNDDIFGLAFHLKMTGRVFPRPAGTQPEKHTRLILDLDDGKRIFFDDVRRFGYVRVLSRDELKSWDFWNSLGSEPLDISRDSFADRLHGTGPVKGRLLDQKIIAGIGNIYADESLFRAGIAPSARLVEKERLRILHDELVAVLNQAIRECGSSIRDYRTANGDTGSFQNSFAVYGKAGTPCPKCGHPLSKAKIASRTTVFCEHCQK